MASTKSVLVLDARCGMFPQLDHQEGCEAPAPTLKTPQRSDALRVSDMLLEVHPPIGLKPRGSLRPAACDEHPAESAAPSGLHDDRRGVHLANAKLRQDPPPEGLDLHHAAGLLPEELHGEPYLEETDLDPEGSEPLRFPFGSDEECAYDRLDSDTCHLTSHVAPHEAVLPPFFLDTCGSRLELLGAVELLTSVCPADEEEPHGLLDDQRRIA
jgi:hypothetical protein